MFSLSRAFKSITVDVNALFARTFKEIVDDLQLVRDLGGMTNDPGIEDTTYINIDNFTMSTFLYSSSA